MAAEALKSGGSLNFPTERAWQTLKQTLILDILAETLFDRALLVAVDALVVSKSNDDD
jgi:hypothetical protein